MREPDQLVEWYLCEALSRKEGDCGGEDGRTGRFILRCRQEAEHAQRTQRSSLSPHQHEGACARTQTRLRGRGGAGWEGVGRAVTFKVDPLHSRVARGNFVLISSNLSPVVWFVQRLCKVSE